MATKSFYPTALLTVDAFVGSTYEWAQVAPGLVGSAQSASAAVPWDSNIGTYDLWAGINTNFSVNLAELRYATITAASLVLTAGSSTRNSLANTSLALTNASAIVAGYNLREYGNASSSQILGTKATTFKVTLSAAELTDLMNAINADPSRLNYSFRIAPSAAAMITLTVSAFRLDVTYNPPPPPVPSRGNILFTNALF